MKPPKRSAATLCLLILLGAGCGGSAASVTTEGRDGAVETTPSTVAEPAEDPVTTLAEETEEEPATEVGESLVTVSIGDETWEFRPTGFMTERCDTSFFGGYWVIMSTGVGILLAGENWAELGVDQTPNIYVKIEDTGVEWVADPDTNLPGVDEGMSQIDSYEIDGSRATGTATFVEANAAYGGNVEPVTGSFEAVCAPEE